MLTGATGLLGRSLLRDLGAAGRRIAVLVRPGKVASAVQRIDELLLDWQEVAAAHDLVSCTLSRAGSHGKWSPADF